MFDQRRLNGARPEIVVRVSARSVRGQSEMTEIATRSSGDSGQQDEARYDDSPDLGNAPTAWNQLEALKWWRTVANGPKLPY